MTLSLNYSCWTDNAEINKYPYELSFQKHNLFILILFSKIFTMPISFKFDISSQQITAHNFAHDVEILHVVDKIH